MLIEEVKSEVEVIKKKRGRKPKNPEEKIYFGEKQEAAVVEYILNKDDSQVRNKIYLTILRPALKKMIESIIRKYNLYVPDEPFDDTVTDALSHLAEQIDKFKIGTDKKAYSYYGTIVKHYVLKRRKNYTKNLGKQPSYETIEDGVINGKAIVNTYERDKKIAELEIAELIKYIKKMVENPQEEGLRKNEIKLGNGLIGLLENWESIIPPSIEKICADGDAKYTPPSKKLVRSSVLLYLREQTGLDTKNIRTNMKKYKKVFLIIRNSVLNDY